VFFLFSRFLKRRYSFILNDKKKKKTDLESPGRAVLFKKKAFIINVQNVFHLLVLPSPFFFLS